MDKPLFIKVNEYKDIKDIIVLIKTKVGEVKKTLYDIDSLKKQEEEELSKWHSQVNDVEKKIDFISQTMEQSAQQ
jgi:predicted  nucleic acid-binding Zn-ribbon protein